MTEKNSSKARFRRDWTQIDPKARDAWVNLLRAHRVATSHINSALVAKHNLTLEEWDFLVHVGSSDVPKRMGDLAKDIFLSPSGMTRMVDRLERRGLVERRAGAADGREALVVITTSGLDLLAAASPTHTEALERTFVAVLSHSELVRLAASLGKVARTPTS